MYFKRHWRGELGLAKSFWVNAVLVNVCLSIFVSLFVENLQIEFEPISTFLYLLTLWTGIVALAAWQFVGIWRSAERRKIETEKAGWAVAAQVIVVLWLMQTAFILLTQAKPQLQEAANILMGDSRVGEHSFRLLNHGTELEFSGGISFGVSEELQTLLNASPSIRVIHLNSHGGRISVAAKMQKIIEHRNLTTYVSKECLSACTVVFMGGTQRYLHRRAEMGFHAISFSGVPQADMVHANAEWISDFVGRGVDRAFATKAFTYAPSDMWMPSLNELQSSGVITSLSHGEFAMTGFGLSGARDDIARELKKTRLYELISVVNPAEFETIIDEFESGVSQGLPEAEVLARARASIAKATFEQLPRASDTSIVSFGIFLVKMIGHLQKTNPIICGKFLFGTGIDQQLDVMTYLPVQFVEEDLAVSEAIIASSIVGEARTISQEDVDMAYEALFADYAEQYGEKGLLEFSNMPDPSTDDQYRHACLQTLRFYKVMVGMPEKESARLLRSIFSEQAD